MYLILSEPVKDRPASGSGKEFADDFAKGTGQVEDYSPSESPQSVEAIQEKSEEFTDSGKRAADDWDEPSEFSHPPQEQFMKKIDTSTEKVTEAKEEHPPQRRFMTGGFGSSGTAGSFGSSHVEKENVPAFGSVEFYGAEKGDGYNGDRGGFGRGDQRGGRGRGFDRDGQRFRDSRDSYRDRDERDSNRDGFRSRGGYGGGGGRDFQGRCGFRGSRN
ncbi:hypothetical protein COOONC_19552 [Cooperia oncophora]